MGFLDRFKKQRATPAERDAEVLRVLEQYGADLSQPRSAMFYVYGSNKDELRAASAALEAEGWSVDFTQDQNGLEIEGTKLINETTVAEFRQKFEQLASTLQGGDYDGWVAQA